jgi:hypothetical protein
MECFILWGELGSKGMVTLYRNETPEPGGPFHRTLLRRQLAHYLLTDDQIGAFEVALDGGHRAQVDVERIIATFSAGSPLRRKL